MDPKRLRTFVAVADLGTVSKAAARLRRVRRSSISLPNVQDDRRQRPVLRTNLCNTGPMRSKQTRG
jgi:hypothetical protein